VVSPPYSIYVGEDKHESKCIRHLVEFQFLVDMSDMACCWILFHKQVLNVLEMVWFRDTVMIEDFMN